MNQSKPTQQAQSPQSYSLYGGFWTRVLRFWLGLLPMGLCELLALPVVSVIYLLATAQRRAVCGNLLALYPEDGPLVAWGRAWHVFHQFGLTYLDRLWHLEFGRELEWQVSGEAHMVGLHNQEQGALVFTIHAGNYDIGSTLFAQQLQRPLHIVRIAEREESLQAMRQAELSRIHPLLHIHYNTPGMHLGLELSNLLRAGQVVAVQCDRVVQDVSPFAATHAGLRFTLPRGPFMLAQMNRVACYPIFLRRIRRLCYQVDLFPTLVAEGEAVKVDDLSTRWLRVLHPFLQQHWDQWFVFEPTLARAA
jgi:predicted LPLAT superfamily acyltransferase